MRRFSALRDRRRFRGPFPRAGLLLERNFRLHMRSADPDGYRLYRQSCSLVHDTDRAQVVGGLRNQRRVALHQFGL